MSLTNLTLLLIEDSSEFAELVEHWVSPGNNAGTFTLTWTDSLAAGMNRLAQGGVDVILLDLGLPDSNGSETFTKTKAHAAGIPIIILSAADSELLALQMIREGAADYLVKSTCNAAALIRAVKYAVVRQKSPVVDAIGGQSPERRMVGVIGAKGGVGATTVACNLAVELGRQTGRQVLLADLDIDAGLVALIFGLDAKYSLLDVVNNIRRLDYTCWETMVNHDIRDLHILPSPGLLGDRELSWDDILHVLTLIRPFYDWIVLDLGRLNGLAVRLLDRLSDVLVVTATAIPALYETKRVVDALLKAGVEGDRLRLVVNQTKKELSLSGSDLNQVFGIPVYARLCADGQELDACLGAQLPAEDAKIRKQMSGLARKMAGLPAIQSGWTFSSLFSLAGRFRKNSRDWAPGRR